MLSPITLGLVAFAIPASAAVNCTREWLKTTADRYVHMQATGSHSEFENLSSKLNYTENNNTKASILTDQPSHPLKIAFNRSTYDTVNCKTFTEIIVTDPDHPKVLATQMSLDGEGNVVKMESLVTDKGDWLFNATGYIYWTSKEQWDPIPVEKRDTRAVLKAAADSYADRCNNANITVPFGTPCARLEGRAYTGGRNLTGNTCNLGLPSHTLLDNRRYVIDEVMGTVDIFLGFQGLDRTHPNEGAPDSHYFRIEGGKIRYIHTVSWCWSRGCGGNGTIPSFR